MTRQQRGSATIELLLLGCFMAVFFVMVEAARFSLLQLKLDRSTSDLTALAADLPPIRGSYDHQLAANLDALFNAAKKMTGFNEDALGMRIEWHQYTERYVRSFSRGQSCDDIRETIRPTRLLRTAKNRSHAEFVQVELCIEASHQRLGLRKLFNLDRLESRAISVRRWWEL